MLVQSTSTLSPTSQRSEVLLDVRENPQGVVPYMWQWSRSQKMWIPIQFCEDPAQIVKAKTDQIFSSASLLSAFSSFLEQHNLDEKLGFGTTFYNLLSIDLNSPNAIFNESTSEEKRLQIMCVEDDEDALEVTTTHW